MNAEIVGTWNSDLNDPSTKNNIGNVTMTFTEDGRLIYDLHEGKKLQRMYMTYRINEDSIISDQASHPQKQKTKYKFVTSNKLILEFEGIETIFLRKIEPPIS
jgi:hypothetical protein